jgi:hypothetical protein
MSYKDACDPWSEMIQDTEKSNLQQRIKFNYLMNKR